MVEGKLVWKAAAAYALSLKLRGSFTLTCLESLYVISHFIGICAV